MGDSDVIKARAHSNVQVLVPNSPGVLFGDSIRARRRILSEPRHCCRRRGTPLFGVALALALHRSRADMRIALAFALVVCAKVVFSPPTIPQLVVHVCVVKMCSEQIYGVFLGFIFIGTSSVWRDNAHDPCAREREKARLRSPKRTN